MEQPKADNLTLEQKLQIAEAGHAAGDELAVNGIKSFGPDVGKLMAIGVVIGIFEALEGALIEAPEPSEIETILKLLIMRREEKAESHGR